MFRLPVPSAFEVGADGALGSAEPELGPAARLDDLIGRVGLIEAAPELVLGQEERAEYVDRSALAPHLCGSRAGPGGCRLRAARIRPREVCLDEICL
jgi:hypothetical protein